MSISWGEETRLRDEIARLRGALERLKKACTESGDFVYAAIATEALSTASQPTTDPTDAGQKP